MRSRYLTLAVCVTLAAVACGQPGTSVSDATVTTPPSDIVEVGDIDVITPPDANGEYPDDLMVSCSGVTFPISALETIQPLEGADPGGVAQAIAPFLESEEGAFWPQEGWQILHMTDEHVDLVATSEEGSLSFMSATKDGSDWTWSGASGSEAPCHLQFVVPPGLNTVNWVLDPAAPALTTESTEISALLTERECVGGIEIGDRLRGPQVVMTEDQVFIAFAAEPPPGDAFTCQGNPETPYVIDLPEPLGDRQLVADLETGIVLDDYLD
jgi:hypothetical protein